jgi:hypothetical protein
MAAWCLERRQTSSGACSVSFDATSDRRHVLSGSTCPLGDFDLLIRLSRTGMPLALLRRESVMFCLAMVANQGPQTFLWSEFLTRLVLM